MVHARGRTLKISIMASTRCTPLCSHHRLLTQAGLYASPFLVHVPAQAAVRSRPGQRSDAGPLSLHSAHHATYWTARTAVVPFSLPRNEETRGAWSLMTCFRRRQSPQESTNQEHGDPTGSTSGLAQRLFVFALCRIWTDAFGTQFSLGRGHSLGAR